MNDPQVSFIFPYRWLNEDKEFLGENLSNMVMKNYRSAPMHPKLQRGYTPSYVAVIKYHAYQPVKVPLTKAALQKALKKAMGNAVCVEYETFFVQTTNKTSLPVMELQLFF